MSRDVGLLSTLSGLFSSPVGDLSPPGLPTGGLHDSNGYRVLQGTRGDGRALKIDRRLKGRGG